MRIPLFIHTDASFENANDTAKTMTAHAASNGYESVGIIDYNSSSAVVKFIKSCMANKVAPLIGCTLTIYSPSRDKLLWAFKNRLQVESLYSLFGMSPPSPECVFDQASELASLVVAANKSKAKNVLATFEQSLFNLFGKKIAVTSALIKSANIDVKSLSLELEPGHIVVLANSLVGYKSVLRLISVRALKKQENISNPDAPSKPLAVTWDDIKTEGEEITVIDPLHGKSFIGALSLLKDEHVDYALRFVSKLDVALDYFGLDYPLSGSAKKLVEKVKSNFPKVGCLPFPTANFAKKEFYDDFVVKVAVQRGQTVVSPFFKKPDEQKYIHQSELVEEYYSQCKLDDPAFLHDYWDTVESVNVPLGNVELPNYDMPTLDVINYAFKLKSVEHPPFLNPDLALAAFDEWITPDIKSGWTLEQYRQRRLNDFCLHKLSLEGVYQRLDRTYEGEEKSIQTPIYLDRHKMEFDIIEEMGFAGYFLIEYDMVSKARELGVPVGDGRGSAAGSLIVYGLEVTDVDPIIHGLQFERFLNPERVSMPDIDVDFGAGKESDRLSVLKYISEKYQMEGARFPSSSQIANINNYQLKSAISAVRKSLSLSMTYDNYLKFLVKRVEVELGINSAVTPVLWEQLLEQDFIQSMMREQPVLRRVLKHAQALSGKMSAYGVHAGGLVISPTTITDYSAIECDDKGNFFSLLDKDDIESSGLIKFDALGLRTLSIIDDAVSQIQDNHDVLIDPRKLDQFDPKVYDLICEQHLCDIFQLESSGMRKLVGDLQPRSIGELGVLSSLYRPGALQSGMVEDYVDVKFDRKLPTYDHPALEKVTKDTFGCIVYQEQVMSITRELAGYSLGEADVLRRAMGKKKIEEMVRQKQVYNSRAQAHWGAHYKEIGIKQGFKFELRINLKDLVDELKELSETPCLDDAGYLSDFESVVLFLTNLLGLDNAAQEQLKTRLNDFHYVVKMFKDQYQHLIEKSCRKKLLGMSTERVEEVVTRVYFALTQYVRFNQVFNKVEKFAGYGFNKSHAIAYSMVTYKSAYLKAHYPVEFYCAALTFKDLSAIGPTVVEAEKVMGIRMLPPHINYSKERFRAGPQNSIRYGFAKLSGLVNCAKGIVDERDRNGHYSSLFDVVSRLYSAGVNLGKDQIFSLAVCGAFDVFIPKRVGVHPDYNGREFMFFLNSIIKTSTVFKRRDERISVLHEQMVNMTDFEWVCYLSALAGKNYLKKHALVPESKLALMGVKVDGHLFDSIVNKLRELYSDDGSSAVNSKSVVGKLIIQAKGQSDSLTVFEIEFLRMFYLLLGDTDLNAMTFKGAKPITHAHSKLVAELTAKHVETENCQPNDSELNNIISNAHLMLMSEGKDLDSFACMFNWDAHLTEKLSKSVTATLNDERDCSGMYITSTPIKILRIADRVEREPPSSIIDGCPITVGMIDQSHHEQKITTYGIVRDVIEKTVKKEDSAWYGEKMLFFTLENGADNISSMIFGNKPVSIMKKVIEDGAVMLVAGEVQSKDQFGLTLMVAAIKRYYPVEDEKIVVVPKL